MNFLNLVEIILFFLKFIGKDFKDNSFKGLVIFLRFFCFWVRFCFVSCRVFLVFCICFCFGFIIYVEKYYLIKNLNYI